MNTFNEIHHPSSVDFELLRPSAVTDLPHSVECGSRWQTYGSSSGWSSEVIARARGEYFERKHFYLDIPVNDTNKLANGLSTEEVHEFTDAFTQTSVYGSDTRFHLHLFDRTAVYRITDFTTCKVPTACLSITECRNNADNNYYPMRDTCGCSAHLKIENALIGAIKESLERQFLLRFWLTLKFKKNLSYEAAYTLLESRPSSTLFRELARSGDLLILDLTDDRFPGTCILLCYGNMHPKAKVQYCAGMAYTDTANNALEKAVLELWQTFRYMQAIDNDEQLANEPQDPYLKHFLACNSYETFQEIAKATAYESSESFTTNHRAFDCHSLLNTLRRLDLNGYIYIAQQNCTRTKFYFCKYFSPNLFLHMNNAHHFNLKNKYSSQFLDHIIQHQLSKMVPFP
ncbi:YcaO-like family protein [Pseudomonas promysalinigenes]|uniref:YcaO-like family protein n=1 Tax=Pseudomonas promysalinigenes TaxID=485898 RepID=UPI003916EC2C